MNVEILKEFIDNIIRYELVYEIHENLDALSSSLGELVDAPQEASFQNGVSINLDSLASSVSSFEIEFSTKDRQRFLEIRAKNYFELSFVEEIRSKIIENPLTPAVVADYVRKLNQDRKSYFENLVLLSDSLLKIGVEVIDLEPGETQVGFQIPRTTFDNNLDGLIKELRAIRLIVRTFSEVATGKVEEIEVGQISTSDPLFLLAQSTPVVLSIGYAVKWAIAQWKLVEEIREIRARTAQIKAFTDKEIKEIFDKKITKTIESAIQEKVAELLEKSPMDELRKKEQQKGTSDALRSLLARVERGMTVEIRMLPHSIVQDGSDVNEVKDESQEMTKLRDLRTELTFPTASENPVLPLPSPDPSDNGYNKPKK